MLKSNYTRLDNILITLVIWRFLPLYLVDWFINRGGKRLILAASRAGGCL